MDSKKGKIFVVGMHRSGTSALSGLLVEMGAYFGPVEQKLPTKVANPKGYWERWDVVLANDALLAKKNLEWHRVSEYSPTSFETIGKEDVRACLGEIVDDYQLHEPWFVKDPRICLTLPCWLSLVDNPICVLVVRDPLQVASSLERRGDCSIHVGLGLWELYTGAALWNTRNCPRILLRYEELLKNPVKVLSRLIEFLNQHGVVGIKLPDEAAVRSWLDSNLQRELIRADSARDIMNIRQQELHDIISSGAAFSMADPWAPSGGGMAALKAFEAQYLSLLNSCNDLNKRNAQLESELTLVRAFKQDILTWNRDLEKCADVWTSSASYRWSRSLIKAWSRVTGRPDPVSPADRIRDIVAAQKNIQGLGEPD